MDCPRCSGSGEEVVYGDGVSVPDETWPCALCLGTGEVSTHLGFLYGKGHYQLTECDECGRVRVCVDDGFMVLCSACWPVVEVPEKEAAE